MTIEKPIAQLCFVREARFPEEFECWFVVSCHHCIQLMKMQDRKCIMSQLIEGSLSIPPSTIGLHDDNTRLSPQMLRFEAYNIADSHSLVVVTLDNQPHLAVSIDIVAGSGNIVVQRIAGIWHVGGTDMP